MSRMVHGLNTTRQRCLDISRTAGGYPSSISVNASVPNGANGSDSLYLVMAITAVGLLQSSI